MAWWSSNIRWSNILYPIWGWTSSTGMYWSIQGVHKPSSKMMWRIGPLWEFFMRNFKFASLRWKSVLTPWECPWRVHSRQSSIWENEIVSIHDCSIKREWYSRPTYTVSALFHCLWFTICWREIHYYCMYVLLRVVLRVPEVNKNSRSSTRKCKLRMV